MKVKMVSLSNQAKGDVDLNDAIFGLEPRQDILHRMVQYQLAKRRAGTHSTKSVGEVSGTKAKPFRQKGTGRARAGTLRASQHRGGAVVFGPKPRSHAIEMPKKLRKLALKNALSAKAKAGDLLVLDSLSMKGPKTKEMQSHLAKLGLTSVLFIDGAEVNDNVRRSAANLHKVDVLPQIGANVYDILRHDKLVLTKDAVEQLEARLS